MGEVIKILHVSTAISWRGGEQQIVNLVEGIIDEGLSAHQVVFCAKGSKIESYCNDHHIEYRTGKKKGGLNIAYTRALMKCIKAFQPDIIHMHDSHAQTAAVLAHKFLGLKTSMVLHRRVDFKIGNSALSSKKYNYRYIKKIICVSKAIEKIVKDSIDKPTEVIYSSNRIGDLEHKVRSGVLRKDLNITDDEVLVANIAALADHKDYPTFIQTAQILSKQNDKYRFAIIGEGSLREELENMVKEEGFEDKITFTGFRNDIPDIIKDIDVFLFTSKMEGLGSVLFDVFSARVPVVASNGGGIGELVQPNKTGRLAEVQRPDQLANFVHEVFLEKEKTHHLIDNAFNLAQQCQYRNMALKTYNIYKELI